MLFSYASQYDRVSSLLFQAPDHTISTPTAICSEDGNDVKDGNYSP